MLIIHIGTPKTASTLMQDIINKDELSLNYDHVSKFFLDGRGHDIISQIIFKNNNNESLNDNELDFLNYTNTELKK